MKTERARRRQPRPRVERARRSVEERRQEDRAALATITTSSGHCCRPAERSGAARTSPSAAGSSSRKARRSTTTAIAAARADEEAAKSRVVGPRGEQEWRSALAGAERDQTDLEAEEQAQEDRRAAETSRSAKRRRSATRISKINDLKELQILTETQYRELQEVVPPGVFKAGMGAEAVYDYVSNRSISTSSRSSCARRCRAPRSQAQEGDQAPARGRGAAQERQQAGVDDLHRAAGHPARTAADGAARRRPLRDLRPERPLPPRDQPQQPPQAAAGARRARTSSCATRSGCCRRRSTR